MKNIRLLIIFIFLSIAATHQGYAQLGFKLTEIVPNGDIGQFFNKGIAPDIYYIDYFRAGKFRTRVGFLYSKLSSRKDTVPQYMVQVGGFNPNPVYIPGYLVNRDFSMMYLHGDVSYRFLHINKFSVFGGLGIVMGKSHVVYYRGFETVIEEEGNVDTIIEGLCFVADVEYQLSKHFDILAEGALNKISSSDLTTSYGHSAFSLGVNWVFFDRPKKEWF